MQRLRLVACLLNVSEARSKPIVESIAHSAIGNTKPLNETSLKCSSTVLNIFSDLDYNRSVITIAAPVDSIEESVFRACKTAYEEIDLSKHRGGHPRLGAVDLVPLHPITPSVTLEECGKIAINIGRRITDTIKGSSVFFFGHADLPLKRGLVTRRKAVSWYEGKGDMTFDGIGWDIGPAPTPRYGCTGVGAIPYVTNCNVTIDTKDLSLGKKIAASIRATSSEGLPGVQSMAFAHEGMVEIACNVEALEELSDEGTFNYTSANNIEERIKEMASTAGVELYGTKVVGYTPEEAYHRAKNALEQGNSTAWETSKEYRM
ncbi:predicted protein [Nematostella vectensis]|uniref:glutamate formimidoyltransferase n=1 Tax=Nematostella vectensis TaxID=45351 RepID=A7RUE4_NEMVE|nr:predicted protein [Nematostella vectensis]|eukprot:XP_001636903.1 predicted protein [Nematostella vectensis]